MNGRDRTPQSAGDIPSGSAPKRYIARALLQRADLVIFDECFAAVDPHTLKKTLALVLEWAATVLVIAHP